MRANWIGLQSEDERSAARRFHVNHAGRDRSVLRKQPPHRKMRRRCIKSVPRRGLARKTKTRRGVAARTRHRGAATRETRTNRVPLRAVIPSGPVSYTILDILGLLTRTPNCCRETIDSRDPCPKSNERPIYPGSRHFAFVLNAFNISDFELE